MNATPRTAWTTRRTPAQVQATHDAAIHDYPGLLAELDHLPRGSRQAEDRWFEIGRLGGVVDACRRQGAAY